MLVTSHQVLRWHINSANVARKDKEAVTTVGVSIETIDLRTNVVLRAKWQGSGNAHACPDQGLLVKKRSHGSQFAYGDAALVLKPLESSKS